MDHAELAEKVAAFPRWHYEIDLGPLKTPCYAAEMVNRARQRRAYFFDRLVALCGGSLAGRRVLDLACNAGYWSLACIEAGCDEVVGIDAREMHIQQAELVFDARGVDPSRFRFLEGNVLSDIAALGRFDIVLCLGILYHVNRPVELFSAISGIADDLLVVDTKLAPGPRCFFRVHHEDFSRPDMAVEESLVLIRAGRPCAS